MGQPAARLGDTTSHGTPLGAGPGLPDRADRRPAGVARRRPTRTPARSSTARSRMSAASSPWAA